MKIFLKVVGLCCVAATASISAVAQGANIDYDKIQILTQKIAPNFYALTGSPELDPGHPEAAGGRIGVLVGSEGVFMVDGTYEPLADKVTAAIKKVTPGPIRFLIDTHYHPDHTGGNPVFARLGAVVFAREETRRHLLEPLPPRVAAVVGKAAS